MKYVEKSIKNENQHEQSKISKSMINRINNILASSKNEKNISESDIHSNKKTNQEEYTKKFVNKNQYNHQPQHDIFNKDDSSSSNLDLQLSNFKYFKESTCSQYASTSSSNRNKSSFLPSVSHILILYVKVSNNIINGYYRT